MNFIKTGSFTKIESRIIKEILVIVEYFRVNNCSVIIIFNLKNFKAYLNCFVKGSS